MGKLKTNLIYNLLYQILILIVPFVTTPYVSRVLLPEGVGVFSVTTAIAKYFFMFALLGMTNYGNRAIAKAKGDLKNLSVVFSNLFYFQLLNSLLITMVYILYVFLIGYNVYGVVAICQIPYVITAAIEISWFFYGMEEFKLMVARNTVIKVLTMAAVFLFVKTSQDVWIYVVINALSLLLGQLCLWPFLKKYVYMTKPDWTLIKSHFKPNLVLFVSVLAVTVYTLMDKIMIEVLSSTIQVGYYENSEKVLNICTSITGAIGAVMLPRISHMMESKNNKAVKKYLEKSMKYIMMLAIAVSFGIIGISYNFSIIFFGEKFSVCGGLIAAIAPSIVFYSWENILRTQYLLPGNRDKIFVMGTVYAAVVNLLVNMLFIPMIGAMGAVYGTVAAQIAASAYQTFKIRKELPITRYITRLIPFLLIGIIMVLVCRIVGIILSTTIISLIAQIICGGFVYCALCIIYMVISKDELISMAIHKIKIGRCDE